MRKPDRRKLLLRPFIFALRAAACTFFNTQITPWKYTKMRIAAEQDLPRIIEIYNSTVHARTSTADTEEVSVAAKTEWFRRHTPGARPILVHEENGAVAAWVSFEPFYGRPAYGKTAEISIYIAPDYRYMGLGKKLLREALERAASLRINTLLAFIFSHNEPSLRLFAAAGFAEWGRLPDVAEMDGKEYSLSILGKRLAPRKTIHAPDSRHA